MSVRGYSQGAKSSQLPKRVCLDFSDFVVMQVTEMAIRISSVSKTPGRHFRVFWTVLMIHFNKVYLGYVKSASNIQVNYTQTHIDDSF